MAEYWKLFSLCAPLQNHDGHWNLIAYMLRIFEFYDIAFFCDVINKLFGYDFIAGNFELCFIRVFVNIEIIYYIIFSVE